MSSDGVTIFVGYVMVRINETPFYSTASAHRRSTGQASRLHRLV